MEEQHSGARLVKINWDDECRRDFLLGLGFEITEPTMKKKRKDNKEDDGNQEKESKNMYGTHSPLYGSDWSDNDAFADRYMCKCGEIQGKAFINQVCPKCGVKVEFRDINLKITGWMILKNYKLIHPVYYKKIASIIGEGTFVKIITFNKKVLLNGELEAENNPKHPFAGIGLTEFYERFDEIMDYYKSKRAKKIDLIEEVMEERRNIFTSCIPVFSSVLRPISFKNENYVYTDIDKKYNVIYGLVELLNVQSIYEEKRKKWKKEKRERMTLPTIHSDIQKHLMILWDLIFGRINTKYGHIKSEIMGGMINFSSRNVIIPDPSLRADEIRLNYMAFLELYKLEIISHIVKISGVSHNEAHNEWFEAKLNYSKKIHEIMNYMIKKMKPTVLINRNPTINFGSLLSMKIVSVKADDSYDFTMSVPIQVLPVLNADFDGDVLNCISLKSKRLIKEFDRVFNPRKNMFVSHNDGLFNSDFNLFKDQIITLYQFNNIE